MFFYCKAQSYEHWIIDAGSSGSRLCRYSIEKNKECRVRSSECEDMNAPTGLADLSPTEQEAVLRHSLSGKAGQLALLGTGGFRRQSPENQKRHRDHLSAVFLKLGYDEATVTILSGEEEARLAYEAARDALGREVAILEAGGATVQFASGSFSLSRPVGVNTVLAGIARGPAGASCYDASVPGKRSFSACKEAIASALQSSGQWQRETNAPTELALLGQSARGLFSLLGTQFDLKTLQTQGETICRLGPEELQKRGVEERFWRRTCFLLSYATALIESTGYERLIQVETNWRDRAATQGKFFPNCKKLD
ncbi:MAG: hypothetical protein HS115_11380 [Spirochaetales bacterium]|nr:hypothetical protein [Spirochaetales bacterium]